MAAARYRRGAGRPEVGTIPDLTGHVSYTNCSRTASTRCGLSSIPDLCRSLGLRIVVASRIDIQRHDFVGVTPITTSRALVSASKLESTALFQT
jgi:hypothetical protein